MKFICDRMLGKLAKKLRMLGIDTAYLNKIDEDSIITSAIKENRLILTRRANFPVPDKRFSMLFIKDNDPKGQIRQVISSFKIHRDSVKPFSRCICCNTLLKPLKKELAEGRVADYVFNTSEDFSECTACKKIYWHGTHYKKMMGSIDDLLSE